MAAASLRRRNAALAVLALAAHDAGKEPKTVLTNGIPLYIGVWTNTRRTPLGIRGTVDRAGRKHQPPSDIAVTFSPDMSKLPVDYDLTVLTNAQDWIAPTWTSAGSSMRRPPRHGRGRPTYEVDLLGSDFVGNGGDASLRFRIPPHTLRDTRGSLVVAQRRC